MRRKLLHLTDLVPGPVTAHPISGIIGTINVTGISSDSRAVAPGHLFVALKGSSGDGRAYAAAAVEAGAVAILTDEREPDASLAKLAESGVPLCRGKIEGKNGSQIDVWVTF